MNMCCNYMPRMCSGILPTYKEGKFSLWEFSIFLVPRKKIFKIVMKAATREKVREKFIVWLIHGYHEYAAIVVVAVVYFSLFAFAAQFLCVSFDNKIVAWCCAHATMGSIKHWCIAFKLQCKARDSWKCNLYRDESDLVGVSKVFGWLILRISSLT